MTQIRLKQSKKYAPIVVAILLAGCAPREVIITPPPPPPPPPSPTLPGVDSVFASVADAYARRGRLVDPRAVETSRRAIEGGKRLFELADSLSALIPPPVDTTAVPDDAIAEGIRRYNAGVEFIQQPTLGSEELAGAAEQFQLALEQNPNDADALYWLSRVYELQTERFMEEGAGEDLIQTLSKLTDLHPLRHDYAGLLAQAYESLATEVGWANAGAWWHRASVLIQDEPELSLAANVTLDTSTTFIYLANASRAFIEAGEGSLALATIQDATAFAVSGQEKDYVSGEIDWLTWDTAISTRKRFDELMQIAASDPAAAGAGFGDLLVAVTLPQAQVEVRHQRSLALFNSGNPTGGIIEIQQAWKEVAPMDSTLRERVREDYGIMAYSLAIEQRESGELRNALAYLLQSEATGFSGAPLSALTRSILLRSDPEASLEAAEMAEAGWAALDAESRRALLEHMVGLHRRLNNRDKAAEYARRFREEFQTGSQ